MTGPEVALAVQQEEARQSACVAKKTFILKQQMDVQESQGSTITVTVNQAAGQEPEPI